MYMLLRSPRLSLRGRSDERVRTTPTARGGISAGSARPVAAASREGSCAAACSPNRRLALAKGESSVPAASCAWVGWEPSTSAPSSAPSSAAATRCVLAERGGAAAAKRIVL
eukprot:CAMPEP_0179935752 /NCGR_PEP_ID=MMETSP0983-20121128/13269_1 /TAXON_ID=483367 /ORGANISM="non described non described, Strain CCMP 2436" /LENGTH=111 /DNA_ID=CAMNT_0021841045 /DNA_START=182 /DNA_END=514 /DNA_ORIENTATION=-